MKNLLFLFFFLLGAQSLWAQLPDFNSIPLDKKEDYNGAADEAALKAARYLLSSPMDKEDIDRLRSTAYVIRWMTGTPNYTFSLGGQVMRFTKKNDDLLSVYMAALTRAALENKDEAKDEEKLNLRAIKLLLDYAKVKENKVKINAELRKAIEAYDKGELEAYLNKK